MDESEMPSEQVNQSGWDFSVTGILEDYGWFILLAAIAIFYIYRQAQPTIDKYLKEKADQEYAAKYHKDLDLAALRIAAQQAAAEKLQEKHKRDAEEYQKKLEEKEAKKREDWLAKQSTSSGQKLGSSVTTTEQSSLKPEYNPLMGDNSRSFRPPRRSACSGGGCGR